MATIERFKILDEADQQFETIVDGRRVTIRLRYNTQNKRWSFDLGISSAAVLSGRKLVLETDLIAPYNFGIGELICFGSNLTDEPTYENLVDGTVGFYSAV